MFPFQTWLPDAHVEAAHGDLVILPASSSKMGHYGFRSIRRPPQATEWAGTAMAVFGTINILYGAFCAFAQTT